VVESLGGSTPKAALTAAGAPAAVDVELVFDSIPDAGRHRVTLSNADGAVCWLSAGDLPFTLRFGSGERLVVSASIARVLLHPS
jgi:hypothetical protein